MTGRFIGSGKKSRQALIFAVMRSILILLLASSGWLVAQQATNSRVSARAELSRTELVIGDQVWLEINLSVPPGHEVQPLPEGYVDQLPGLETVRYQTLETLTETPERLLQQRLLVTSFDSGYVSVPPLPYYCRDAAGTLDTAFTNNLVLRVRTVAVGANDELRPIKPIIEEPLNLYDFWPAFLLVVLGLVGWLTYRNFRGSQHVAPPPPPPPADLRALNALKELEALALWQQGNTKDYYSRLTRIFRQYLTDRFGLAALEMTSGQINRELQQTASLSAEQLGEIRQLLQLSDLVKFAKATPAAELHPAGLERVRQFVRSTGPVVPTAASASPSENEPL